MASVQRKLKPHVVGIAIIVLIVALLAVAAILSLVSTAYRREGLIDPIATTTMSSRQVYCTLLNATLRNGDLCTREACDNATTTFECPVKWRVPVMGCFCRKGFIRERAGANCSWIGDADKRKMNEDSEWWNDQVDEVVENECGRCILAEECPPTETELMS